MKMKKAYSIIYILAFFITLSANAAAASNAAAPAAKDVTISNKDVQIKISANMDASVYSLRGSMPAGVLLLKTSLLNEFTARGQKNFNQFRLAGVKKNQKVTDPKFSGCRRHDLTFISADKMAEVILTFYVPEKQTNAVLCFTSIKNLSKSELQVEKIVSSSFTIDAKGFGEDSSFKFWSFQGGSYSHRPDWIMPLNKTYYRENFQGMNAPDYGGGIPVVDLWTKSQGVAFASLSMQPEQISLPVRVLEDGKVSFQIKDSVLHTIKPGEMFHQVPYAIIVHKGDYYNALKTYSSLMQMQGLSFARTPKGGFETEWCAWGYERNFNKEQILQSLEKVKSLGLNWVTIDDGWQNADGDWKIDKRKFPGGEQEFIDMIKTIHSYSFKVRLWWVPFETHDSIYNVKNYPARMTEYGMKFQSAIAIDHPDWFLLNKDQSRVQVSWWNSYLICPAYQPVREHFKEFAKRAIKDWGVDGFKIDGQNFNAVPPCYNPAHRHADPQDASRAVPLFFKDIYQTATALNPDVVIQLCPCGDNFSIYNLPYTNQTVASDPLSSWQVRTKGKTFKALYGKETAYSGDHVELTNRRWDAATQKFQPYTMEDFASTIGIGGVPSTKFTVSTVAQSDSSLILTAEKELYWKKWLSIYKNEKLSLGDYINLYDGSERKCQ
jgi:alpha-galactosidase